MLVGGPLPGSAERAATGPVVLHGPSTINDSQSYQNSETRQRLVVTTVGYLLTVEAGEYRGRTGVV